MIMEWLGRLPACQESQDALQKIIINGTTFSLEGPKGRAQQAARLTVSANPLSNSGCANGAR
jgi:hypothetical protein